MKNKKLTLPEHDQKSWSDLRIKIVNDTLTEYALLNNFSTSYLKENHKRVATLGKQEYFHKDDLILSIPEGFVFNGLSFEILYQVHEDLK